MIKKTFFNDVFLAAVSALSFFCFIAAMIFLFRLPNYNIIDALYSVAKVPPVVLFVLFLFVSFEFFYRNKSYQLEETIMASKNGFAKLILKKLAFMTAVDAAFSVSAIILIILSFVKSPVEGVWTLLPYALSVVFLYVFLTLLLAVFIGCLLSFIEKKLVSYVIMLLITFSSSNIGALITDGITQGSGIDFFKYFYRWICIFDDSGSFQNYYFGVSVQSYKFQLIFAWLSFCLALIILLSFRNKIVFKYAASTVLFGMCAVFFVFFAQPVSKFLSNENPKESIMEIQNYYLLNKKPEIEKANFNIIKYDLDLTVRRNLKAAARLTFDKEVNEIKLTLYHTYNLKSVADNTGEALSFTQNGDYIHISCAKPVNEIILNYDGSSPQYYSNSQAIFLPGYFAYYPRAGYMNLYDSKESSVFRRFLPEKTQFTVKIDSKKPVYSNLDSVADGQFGGVSDNLTLMSGFAKKIEVDGVRVIYPYLDELEPEKKIRTAIAENRDIFNKTLFITPNVNASSPYLNFAPGSDCTLANLLNLELEDYEAQLVNLEKRDIARLSYSYQNERAVYDTIMGFAGDKNEIYSLFKQCLEKSDVQSFLKLCDAYVDDDSDIRTQEQFLQDLLK